MQVTKSKKESTRINLEANSSNLKPVNCHTTTPQQDWLREVYEFRWIMLGYYSMEDVVDAVSTEVDRWCFHLSVIVYILLN